jgi:SH3 domain protein
LALSLLTVNAAENNYKQAYITDKLSTFIHTGPGTNYRILGTVFAGSTINITGLQENDYSEIIDDKSRKAWIETKYVTTEPVLRISIEELNKKISSNNNYTSQLDGQVNTLTSRVNTLLSEKKTLTTKLQSVSDELEQTRLKVKDQDMNILKEWFFTGAIVLGIGLILGLMLPKLFTRKRNTMQSWS